MHTSCLCPTSVSLFEFRLNRTTQNVYELTSHITRRWWNERNNMPHNLFYSQIIYICTAVKCSPSTSAAYGVFAFPDRSFMDFLVFQIFYFFCLFRLFRIESNRICTELRPLARVCVYTQRIYANSVDFHFCFRAIWLNQHTFSYLNCTICPPENERRRTRAISISRSILYFFIFFLLNDVMGCCWVLFPICNTAYCAI